MKKIFKLISVLLILSMILVGCTDNKDNKENDNTNNAPVEKTAVNIVGLKGPTSIGMIKLIDEKALNSDNYNVNYEVFDSPTLISPKILQGEVQIAAIPTNLASVLYNKSQNNIQFLAENTLGVLYVVGKSDANISNIKDLEGKTIAISGKGLVPEYVINYILQNNNLQDKVELVYLPDHSTVAQTLLAGDYDAVILPQPFVTQVSLKNKDMKILIDLNKEWETASQGKSTLAMGCVIVNKEFANNNKDFVNKFLEEYKKSVEFVNANPSEASILVEKNKVINNAKLVEKAIPNCSIVFKTAQDAKEEIKEFLQILFDSNEKSVGGKLPDENFYYQK